MAQEIIITDLKAEIGSIITIEEVEILKEIKSARKRHKRDILFIEASTQAREI
jgi:hypothetical protein